MLRRHAHLLHLVTELVQPFAHDGADALGVVRANAAGDHLGSLQGLHRSLPTTAIRAMTYAWHDQRLTVDRGHVTCMRRIIKIRVLRCAVGVATLAVAIVCVSCGAEPEGVTAP